jgi:hypothetical protein
VPVSTFEASAKGNECAGFGREVRFPVIEIRKLYSNRSEYNTKVEQEVFLLANEGYLRNSDATRQHDAVLAAAVPLPSGPRDSSGLSGVWSLKGNIAGVPFAPKCHLRQQDNKLSGTCVMEGYEAEIGEGTLGEGTARWIWPFKSQIILQFSGVIGASGTMSGVVSAPGPRAEGQWSATKSSR